MLKTESGGDDSLVKAFDNFNDIVIYDQFYMSKKLVKLLSSDFNFVLFFCGLLVFIFLTISFGRIELSLISFLPMFISWIWILGLMSLFGIKFNIINIIISTFIFGLGDDFSIFMTEGLMQEYSRKRKSIQSYKTAMLLSAITMIIGIGVLVFAKHPAMKSLGAVTLIGMVTVVVLSYTISPFLFKWLTTKSGKMRQTPLTFQNLVKSIYSFAFFLFGSIGLNILGFILFAFRKKPGLKTKMFYHIVLQKLAAFVIRNMPGVNTKVVNEYRENFNKPSIIISNHQSHIDLMLMLMLTPKLIILTNQWVWNSPFYGQIVKYLDFYPVASGIEDSVELLETKVKEGYSILIFPEGTRSADCSIKRFHKGAFFLAERFNIDVVPVMIHGVGHRVTKGELVLKPGKMLVTILKRISLEDKSYGENYSKRAKGVRRMYAKKYDEIGEQFFTPEYFKHKIIDSYIFKGAKTEWYARLSLKFNNYFDAIISKLPGMGNHLDLFCGKGIFPMMLSMVNSEQHIVAYDQNKEDIILAQNISSKPDNLQFISDNILKKSQKFNSISIINRLQYFDFEKQGEIIKNAIDRLDDNGKLIITRNFGKNRYGKILSRLERYEGKFQVENIVKLINETQKEFCQINSSEMDGMQIVEITK
jgi:1-acyl-sn-glycerol-3-phosphate acyltransferase